MPQLIKNTLVTIFVTCCLVATAQANSPKTKAAARLKKVAQLTINDAQSIIDDAQNKPDGLTGAIAITLLKEGKISGQNMAALLYSPDAHKVLSEKILSALASGAEPTKSAEDTLGGALDGNGGGSSKPSSPQTVKVDGALKRMVELTVKIQKGRGADINPDKLGDVADVITDYNKSGDPDDIKYPMYAEKCSSILNAGLAADAHIVKKGEDPFDVIKNCK